MIGLAVFVVLVVGPGFTIGYLNVPDGWYAGLNKPWFNPANWIFAPVWAVIYLLIAVAGSRMWERHHYGIAMRLWLLQNGAQLPLVADFLFCPFAWVCSDYHSGAIRRDPGFYRAPVEFGPHLLGTFRALCRLGRRRC